MLTFAIGDIVKMTETLPDEDGNERYRVLELRGDRVLVGFICADLSIPPTYVFPLRDLAHA